MPSISNPIAVLFHEARLAEWREGHLNVAADDNDIEVITRRINGGLVGLPERRALFAKIFPFVSGSKPIEQSTEWRVQEGRAAQILGSLEHDPEPAPDLIRADTGFRKDHAATINESEMAIRRIVRSP